MKKSDVDTVKQLVKYADIVTGFSTAQAIALWYIFLKQEGLIKSVMEHSGYGWWITMFSILAATAAYA